MPTSHYFPLYYSNNESEKNLYQDLVDEQIKLFGTDVYYITRKTFTDNALNDVEYSEYSESIVIEVMLQNVEGFGAQSEFISKFGLRVTDEVTFTMSVRRWQKESIRLNNLDILDRPNEGDLIFLPLTGDLYEIKFVEREQPFYQLGKLYFFTMTCEIYEVGNEEIDTGIPEIDILESNTDYEISLTLSDSTDNGAGTGDFVVGETIEYYTAVNVAGNTAFVPTGIKAEVSGWDAPSRTLSLINNTGDFDPNYYVYQDSAREVETYYSTGLYLTGPQDSNTYIENTNSEYDDNKYIEDSADDILDFTEVNPFGEYGNLDNII